ncbi:MAG: glutamate synthase large subunit [Lachnospiraceae bacterium]|nr:glutamate synthase large subunit [Lachnospiraceae bacterium]
MLRKDNEMMISKEQWLRYGEITEHDACGIGAVADIRGRKSRGIVDDALKIVEKLEHRAGKDALGETGDGVGILVQICHSFFKREASGCGITVGEAGTYAVGMFFFPQEALPRRQAQKMLEIIFKKNGLKLLGWRAVPVCPEVLGQTALSCMPCILQCFVEKPEETPVGLPFERLLYLARREFEQSNDNTYVVSLSSRTIVYKGMFLVGQLRKFYPDLQSEDFQSAIAMVHSRFSTNTTPSWERAHPNRFILHNGEINTIRGNVDRMIAREETMSSPVMRGNMDRIFPVISAAGSDSAMLDNTVEFLVMNGMELPLAMMTLIPEPWKNDYTMTRQKRDLYRYYATMMEPWDGPASILFSDGEVMGAVLDRNGLRPSRYYLMDDDRLILSSEVGVLDIDESHVLRKDRLRPGKMLLVDTIRGQLIEDEEIKQRYAARQPYGEWLDQNLVHLADLAIPNVRIPEYTQEMRDRLYRAFGYTYEQVKDSILPMARTGQEATAAMGADEPLAVLSRQYPPLFDYFKQQFAQVTNPPIDAIREECVTDTTVYLGRDGNLLEECPENCRVLQINNPILTRMDLIKIKAMKKDGFHVETVSLLYYKNTSLERAVERLFVECDKAYKKGANIVILSDRGVDENHMAIPSFLAVSAMEQYLIRTKKRTAVSIILESAEPRDVHHFALLLGYGARAVCPYLAHECIEECIELGLLDKDAHTAIDDYNSAILHGIVKIASKMGISTLQSYQSAQIFEAVGIRQDVIDKYFTHTVSRIGGIGLDEMGEAVEYHHSRAFDPLGLGVDTTLDSVGFHKLREGSRSEAHLFDAETIVLLQEAVRENDPDKFRAYSRRINSERAPQTLRSLLDFQYPKDGGIDVSEVENADAIVRRFKTGAMSYGSISQEAHECLAAAMNRIGGKSNSGEGGEAKERYGTELASAIKQVASGRFGVTSAYLCSAKEIQIKMAQGAKPGEGGHLPGKKVYPWIAKTRHSTPGVSLISPPPHHDIYSIEDLAQLIFDLKNANRRARISVKLVSEAGVGTIACGVAKAGAQVVLISGFDGGTGAAPRSSIHNAGLPWELGLAEAHDALIKNGLRERVVLETDGKLLTGKDVAVAAILGAEEYGFATAPLIAMGCVMMRVCNLDTCPAGIATQNPLLRERFCGKPEYIERFMYFVAEELRSIMARLGVRTVDELVGRRSLLKLRDDLKGVSAGTPDVPGFLGDGTDETGHFRMESVYPFELDKTADIRLLLPAFKGTLKNGRPHTESLRVSGQNRTFGTILGSEITRKFGDSLPDDTAVIKAKGGGGQSFGAFIPHGMTIRLEGDSNDYFGKGLSGGKLVVFPPAESRMEASDNVIIGNVALYGATSGEAYICGKAGERFCVRNSGAEAVAEGVGDHGCEYMTGGCAVILGETGKNFAAGMSGGIAYVLDKNHELYMKLNKALVSMTQVTEKADILRLRHLIERHVAETGSKKGREILEHWEEELPLFKKILPVDYDRMVTRIYSLEEKGMSREDAELEAFESVQKEG